MFPRHKILMQDIQYKGVKMRHLEQSKTFCGRGQLISTAKVNWDSFPHLCCMTQVWVLHRGCLRQAQQHMYLFIWFYLCRHSPDTCEHLCILTCAHQAGNSLFRELGRSGFLFPLLFQVMSDYSWTPKGGSEKCDKSIDKMSVFPLTALPPASLELHKSQETVGEPNSHKGWTAFPP